MYLYVHIRTLLVKKGYNLENKCPFEKFALELHCNFQIGSFNPFQMQIVVGCRNRLDFGTQFPNYTDNKSALRLALALKKVQDQLAGLDCNVTHIVKGVAEGGPSKSKRGARYQALLSSDKVDKN